MLEINKIHQGDCIEQMKLLEENSIDAIITDPPYGLEFYGVRNGISLNLEKENLLLEVGEMLQKKTNDAYMRINKNCE